MSALRLGQAMMCCIVALSLIGASRVALAQTTTSAGEKEKALLKGFDAKVSSVFGSNYRDHRDATSILILNGPYIKSVTSLFLASQLSVHWNTDSQPLPLPSGIFKTASLATLTREDDWPCSKSCTDRCDSLLKTENSLRELYSDKQIADIAFDNVTASFSFALSDSTLALESDFTGGTIGSKVLSGPAFIIGSTSAKIRNGFEHFCFPIAGTQVPKTQVPLADSQNEWAGTIDFAIGPDNVSQILELSDNNLHFTLITGQFLSNAYQDANTKMLHCSVPFEPALNASRLVNPESVLVKAPVFPESPVELSHVSFYPLSPDSHRALKVYQRPLLFQIVATRVP